MGPVQQNVTEYLVSMEVDDIDSNDQENNNKVTVKDVTKHIEDSVSKESESTVPSEESNIIGESASGIVQQENTNKNISETQNVSESQGDGGTPAVEQEISSEPQSSSQDKITEDTGDNNNDQSTSANTNVGDDQVSDQATV